MSSYIESLFSVKDKVVIVTGGSRGIGAEVSLALKKSGANVVCLSRSKLPIIKELQENYLECDLTEKDSFLSICELTQKKFKRIDALVNIAGVSFSNSSFNNEIDRFKATLEVNLDSVFQNCLIASDFMNTGGSIINITSIGASQGFPDNPGYVASKGAVKALSRALALDFSKLNIRVNTIAPGYIKTSMTEKSFNNFDLKNERVKRMIIQRWGNCSDVVGGVIYLLSEASSYVTGAELVIDGGWLAKGL